jgi:hypothetical protein
VEQLVAQIVIGQLDAILSGLVVLHQSQMVVILEWEITLDISVVLYSAIATIIGHVQLMLHFLQLDQRDHHMLCLQTVGFVADAGEFLMVLVEQVL